MASRPAAARHCRRSRQPGADFSNGIPRILWLAVPIPFHYEDVSYYDAMRMLIGDSGGGSAAAVGAEAARLRASGDGESATLTLEVRVAGRSHTMPMGRIARGLRFSIGGDDPADRRGCRARSPASSQHGADLSPACIQPSIEVDDDRAKEDAIEVLRTLIDEIYLAPEDGELAILLRGDLVAILTFAADKKKPGPFRVPGYRRYRWLRGQDLNL